jgi:hypothetical protein
VCRPIVGVKTGSGNFPSTSTTRGVTGRALMRAVDLYALFSYDEGSVPSEPRRKCPRSSPPPKAISQPSDAFAVEGMTVCDVCFSFI